MAGLELLSDQGFRIDGRKPKELRQIRSKIGVFSQADGSAYLEQGNTKVLAAVYGPHEVHGSKLKSQDRAVINCQYSAAVFSTGERKRRPRGDRKSTEMSAHLKQTFQAAVMTHLYPRSQIDIFVEVLQSDGSNYCVCVNAATLALIDAGIPLKDYICACSASYISDTPVVDVNYVEESQGGPEMIVATLPKSSQIVFMEMNGKLHEDHLSSVVDIAVDSCKDLYNIFDQRVQDHVSQMSRSLDT